MRIFPTVISRRISYALLGLGLTVGLAVGVGAYTFVYAKGVSYMYNDPAVCANCHIMQDHYDAWSRSSHHAVAVCNDCHTPPGLVGKYITKARNGWNHSVAFTTGWFHEPIQITAKNKAVTEKACRKCHGDIVMAMDGSNSPEREPVSCIRCHSTVGHLE
jgi:cytochrome c nitrite reductase small subunit